MHAYMLCAFTQLDLNSQGVATGVIICLQLRSSIASIEGAQEVASN